jgi:hypothetical protein
MRGFPQVVGSVIHEPAGPRGYRRSPADPSARLPFGANPADLVPEASASLRLDAVLPGLGHPFRHLSTLARGNQIRAFWSLAALRPGRRNWARFLWIDTGMAPPSQHTLTLDRRSRTRAIAQNGTVVLHRPRKGARTRQRPSRAPNRCIASAGMTTPIAAQTDLEADRQRPGRAASACPGVDATGGRPRAIPPIRRYVYAKTNRTRLTGCIRSSSPGLAPAPG